MRRLNSRDGQEGIIVDSVVGVGAAVFGNLGEARASSLSDLGSNLSIKWWINFTGTVV